MTREGSSSPEASAETADAVVSHAAFREPVAENMVDEKVRERLFGAGFFGVDGNNRPPVRLFVEYIEEHGMRREDVFSIPASRLGELYRECAELYAPDVEEIERRLDRMYGKDRARNRSASFFFVRYLEQHKLDIRTIGMSQLNKQYAAFIATLR